MRRLSDWRVIAALVAALAVVVVIVVVVATGGDDGAEGKKAVESRITAEDPAGVGEYKCDEDVGPEFFCYSGTGDCQGDRRYQVYFDQDNGTFRYNEQGPVRDNSYCKR